MEVRLGSIFVEKIRSKILFDFRIRTFTINNIFNTVAEIIELK